MEEEHEGPRFEFGDKLFSPDPEYPAHSVSTPVEWGYEMDPLWQHRPSPPQSSLVAADLQPPSDGDLVSIPREPIEPLLSPPLPTIDHTSIDPPQSPVALELQPSPDGDLVKIPVLLDYPPLHSQTDLLILTVQEELQAWKLPNNLSSAPTDVELLENHLRPASARMPRKLFRRRVRDLLFDEKCRGDVNAGLPGMNPWELPGLERDEGSIETHYLTDHLEVCFGSDNVLKTPDGYWRQRDWGTAIHATKGDGGGMAIIGVKKTFDFRSNRQPRTNTKWIMNIYYHVLSEENNADKIVENRLVLCHVLQQADGFDPRPRSYHQGPCNGSSAMHHGLNRRSDPIVLNSYMTSLQDLLFGPDPGSTDIRIKHSNPRGFFPPTDDHGQSKKRKKNSDVWDYFTKIFARDLEGNLLTFAACNHCSKVLTAGSKGGTTHLARHACSCKFKPVQAGRNYKADVRVS